MKILTIFAHPDDETMLTGGTLALLARAGAEMDYLCATRGEGGELGEPSTCSRDEIGRVREQELICAIQALGGGNLTFLNYTDPLVGENEELYPYTDDFDGLVEQISDHIYEIQPDAILTHGANGEYGHPGHILTHQAVRVAVEKIRPGRFLRSTPNRVRGETSQVSPVLLYTFCADFPGHPRPRHANPDNPAHLILDVTPVMAQKEKAAYCHRSQNALFVRRGSQQAGYRLTVPETLLKVESLHRLYPPVNNLPEDALTDLLNRTYAVEQGMWGRVAKPPRHTPKLPRSA
jgi:LmbE family N-acetylglucosaminyl deacetylase